MDCPRGSWAGCETGWCKRHLLGRAPVRMDRGAAIAQMQLLLVPVKVWPDVRVAVSPQLGWLPFAIQRADAACLGVRPWQLQRRPPLMW